MRIFLAVGISLENKRKISKYQSELKLNGGRGNFSREENFHITLAFIGETEPKELQKICSACEKMDFSPFEVEINKCGRFGSIAYIGGKSNILESLANNLRNNLKSCGISYDTKPFKAHITICREYNGTMPPFEGFTQRVTSLEVMKSERIDGILKYTSLFSVKSR